MKRSCFVFFIFFAIALNSLSFAQNKPDLTVPSGSFTPVTISPGGTLTINASVRNDGSGSAGGSVLAYYLSSNTSFTTSDYLLGTTNVPSLSSGNSNSQQLVVTFPSNSTIPAGTYYVGWICDANSQVNESNEANGYYLTSPQLTVTAPVQLADLIVPSGSFTPVTISPGGTLTINASVRNDGSGSAGGSVLAYYLSSNTSFTTSDYLLGTTNVPSLSAGSSSSQQLTVTFPSNSTIPAGTYYVGWICDANSQVNESNEANGYYLTSPQLTVTSPVQLADLTVPSGSFTPVTIAPGGTLTINASVRNDGSASASGSVLAYYLSSNTSVLTI